MKTLLTKHQDTYKAQFAELQGVKLMWHHSFWDGPINGICLHDGVKYWYEQVDDVYGLDEVADECCLYRAYLLVLLTSEQMAAIIDRHNKFRKMVGTHCDYDENGMRSNDLSLASNKEFYLLPKYKLEWQKENAIVGWFRR